MPVRKSGGGLGKYEGHPTGFWLNVSLIMLCTIQQPPVIIKEMNDFPVENHVCHKLHEDYN